MAPRAVDKKIARDQNLKSALQLAGKNISGSLLHESGQWINFLFEEVAVSDNVPEEVVNALRLGPNELGGNNEIDDNEAREIASNIMSAGKEKKRFKEIEDELASLKNPPKKEDSAKKSTMKRKLSDVLGDPQVNTERLNDIKSALNDPDNVSIVVNLGNAGSLSDAQKGKINAALDDNKEIKDAEAKVKSMVSNLFTAESRYRYPTDEIIVERWQRLAGIIK